MKKFIFVIVLSLFITSIYSDEMLLSAKDLLTQYSDNFRKNVSDYEAEINWIQDDVVNKGVVQYKNPQKIKISFSEPNNQVICSK